MNYRNHKGKNMKKSDNLIIRVDPDLKNLIDKKAGDFGITTSEFVREILSVVFLIDYENKKFANYIFNKLEEYKEVLNQIINNPLIKDDSIQKKTANDNLERCFQLERIIKGE